MDKDKILNFLKKNAFALTCGVVALAAVVTAFYPFSGKVQQLTADSQQEAAKYATLNGYTRTRHVPSVDPTKATLTELPSFPNHDQVEVGQKAIAKLAEQSEKAADAVLDLNDTKLHPPLVPDSLPTPVSDTPKFLFAAVYKNALSTDPAMSGHGSPSVPPPIQANPGVKPDLPLTPLAADERLASVKAENLFNDVLHAGQPADAKLVEARRAWLRDNIYQPRIIQDAAGAPINQAEVDRDFAAAAKLVPDQLDQEIAAAKRVYLDKDAFAPQASILTNGNPQLADIWFAQLSFWMQRDVAEAVVAIDVDDKGAATAIANSPVKRILGLSLMPIPMYLFPTPAAGAAGPSGGPNPATEVQPLPLAYTRSPTGRTSNGMYDVVPFHLTVDVEADHVNQFIAALTKDRLIYVYNQDLFSVDSGSLAPLGYLYGSRPVVRLSLTGEELFLRKWTAPLMPLRIKILLGLAQPAPGTVVGPLGTSAGFVNPAGGGDIGVQGGGNNN